MDRTLTSVPSSRVPAHVFRRRRLAVGSAAAVVVALLASTAGTLATSGGVPASAAGGGPVVERITVVAVSGDSLWTIAARHRGSTDHATYVDRLVRLNGGASIQAGQIVVLP